MSAYTLTALCIFVYYFGIIDGGSFSNCDNAIRCYQECSFSSPCDTLPAIPSANELHGQIVFYRTSHQSNEKFNEYRAEWSKRSNTTSDTISLTIDSNQRYQQMVGFGAAFTDAVVFNLNKMHNITASRYQNNHIIYDILYSYFAWNDSDTNNTGGCGYLFGRLPIASCDFSPYSYSYLPVKHDFDLNHFSLTPQDLGNKSDPYLQFGRMDMIHIAQDIIRNTNANHALHLFATPWTAPPWMKVDVDTDLDPTGFIKGHLNPNRTYWQTYADYFVKYIDAYKNLGNVEIEAVTPQNEPHSGSHWESMTWNDLELMQFIGEYLGPALDAYHSDIQIWIHDGQKVELPEDIAPYFVSESVSKYVNAIAMHWYLQTSPTPGCPSHLCTGSFKELHKTYEFVTHYNKEMNDDMFMINTEACTGFNVIESPPVRGVSLGDWFRGMQYAEDIIGDMQNGVSGWIDWNMILDMNGGPNHVNNTCDAPIVVDFEKHKYYKQPMYYHMAHITRFILRDSHRIDVTSDEENKDLWYTAVVDDDTLNQTVVVLMNTNAEVRIDIQLHDDRKGALYLSLPPHSIQTVIYGN